MKVRRKPPKHLPKRFSSQNSRRLLYIEFNEQRYEFEFTFRDLDEKAIAGGWTPRFYVGWLCAMLFLNARHNSRYKHFVSLAPHVMAMEEKWLVARDAGNIAREDFEAEFNIALHKDAGTPDLPQEDHPDFDRIASIFEKPAPREDLPPPPRPHGVWPAIFQLVRSIVEKQFGVSVSVHTLKGCLDEYRRMCRVSH